MAASVASAEFAASDGSVAAAEEGTGSAEVAESVELLAFA